MKAVKVFDRTNTIIEINEEDIIEYCVAHTSGKNGESIEAHTNDQIYCLLMKNIGRKKFNEIRKLVKEKGLSQSKHPLDHTNSYAYRLKVVQ